MPPLAGFPSPPPPAVMAEMRFIVAQIGARHGYAVPAILDAAGLLERFYTDICGDIGWGRRIAGARFVPGLRPRLSRLAGRRLPGAIRGRTRTFGWPTCHHAWRAGRTRSDPAAAFREHLRFSDALGRAMAGAGYGAATHIYAMLGECAPFLIEGSSRGLRIVADVYIPLSADRLLARERRDFPDWEPEAPDFAAIRRDARREHVLLTRSHHFVCPSPVVQDDLATFGILRDRTSLVPYGVHPRWLALAARTVRGRVLFVGEANLRKGIHYLALAAERLRSRGRGYAFRVAGGVARAVAQQPLCRHLDFLGRIPRDAIHEEFAAADVLVLPSLAEGSAGATYEALAAGVPVVATPAAGSVVRDGIEGRLVPERDPLALADAIAEIVEDREKRARMSVAARERARDYTWERYGERLVQALQSVA
jgi:glycosyltransferase involved in cell wall biosynthesis